MLYHFEPAFVQIPGFEPAVPLPDPRLLTTSNSVCVDACRADTDDAEAMDEGMGIADEAMEGSVSLDEEEGIVEVPSAAVEEEEVVEE